MSDSETSVNNNITYKTNNGENILDYKKQQTTDTDFYFNMIANPNKTIMPNDSATSESPLEESPRESVRSESDNNHRYNKTEREKTPQTSPRRDSRQTPKSPQDTPRAPSPVTEKPPTSQYIPARFTEEYN